MGGMHPLPLCSHAVRLGLEEVGEEEGGVGGTHLSLCRSHAVRQRTRCHAPCARQWQ